MFFAFSTFPSRDYAAASRLAQDHCFRMYVEFAIRSCRRFPPPIVVLCVCAKPNKREDTCGRRGARYASRRVRCFVSFGFWFVCWCDVVGFGVGVRATVCLHHMLASADKKTRIIVETSKHPPHVMVKNHKLKALFFLHLFWVLCVSPIHFPPTGRQRLKLKPHPACSPFTTPHQAKPFGKIEASRSARVFVLQNYQGAPDQAATRSRISWPNLRDALWWLLSLFVRHVELAVKSSSSCVFKFDIWSVYCRSINSNNNFTRSPQSVQSNIHSLVTKLRNRKSETSIRTQFNPIIPAFILLS